MTIYDKINNLKNSLDKEKSIIEIKDIQKKIMLDEKLINKIRNKEKVREEEKIREYLHLENQVNYIVLSINKELNEVFRSNKYENHSR